MRRGIQRLNEYTELQLMLIRMCRQIKEVFNGG